MEGKCHGTWDSTVGGEYDGVFKLRHLSGGGCSGSHVPPAGSHSPLEHCDCSGTVTLKRRSGGILFTYVGEVSADGKRITGRRRRDDGLDDDPEWIADKRPGPIDDDDDDEDKSPRDSFGKNEQQRYPSR